MQRVVDTGSFQGVARKTGGDGSAQALFEREGQRQCQFVGDTRVAKTDSRADAPMQLCLGYVVLKSERTHPNLCGEVAEWSKAAVC